MTVINPELADIANLLFAEDAGPRVSRIAWYLIGRDPTTGPLFAELQHMASDAGITVGSTHWALSTFELHRQAGWLMASDGRTWKRSADLLGPERIIGVDREGLIAILSVWISRSRGDTSRLRRVRERLRREMNEGG